MKQRKKWEQRRCICYLCVQTWNMTNTQCGQVTVINQKGKKKKGGSLRARSCFFLLLSLQEKAGHHIFASKIHNVLSVMVSRCDYCCCWKIPGLALTSVQAQDKAWRCVSHRELWCFTYWQSSPFDKKDRKRVRRTFSSLDFGTM